MANFTKSASLRYSLPSWSPLEAIIFPGTHSFIKVSPFLQGWKTMSFFPKKKWGTLGISFFGTGGEWSWILYVPLYGGSNHPPNPTSFAIPRLQMSQRDQRLRGGRFWRGHHGGTQLIQRCCDVVRLSTLQTAGRSNFDPSSSVGKKGSMFLTKKKRPTHWGQFVFFPPQKKKKRSWWAALDGHLDFRLCFLEATISNGYPPGNWRIPCPRSFWRRFSFSKGGIC